jgi:UDP-N-acetylmuramate: L-alanyl-gamma-D-glutamyl-meso-diaminopimelate ligase
MKSGIKRVHCVGVCGIAMGTLAMMLADSGYQVSGSDSGVYPPMSDLLASSGVELYSEFNPANINNTDLAVIGNAVSRGNSEAEHVLDNRIPYCSMAQALRDFFLKDKEVIAVAGTHGKSTTASLLAHILDTAGLEPSLFVGAVANNYSSSYRLGNGRLFVIEGDEYDSAFFEKVPKMTVYRPQHAVLTSLEFDHADIFGGIDEIKTWFKRLVNIIPSNGNIIFPGDCGALAEAAAGSLSRIKSFGQGFDFDIEQVSCDTNGTDVMLSTPTGSFAARTGLFGSFNLANIIAASAMALELGVSSEKIAVALSSFKGVKRRQELIYRKENIRIYEDFAHHPTALRLVLESFRQRHPDALLWAIYEPRSATSRRNVFQNELPLAFLQADRVLIKTPYRIHSIPESERIDMDKVNSDLISLGKASVLYDDIYEIISAVKKDADPGKDHCIVILSNGGFDGIYKKIMDMFDAVFTVQS